MTKGFHFIGLDNSAMRDLAIELKKSGHAITGSAEVLTDESRANLLKSNLLPEKDGWSADRVNASGEVVIAPHISRDNPELKKAQELKLKIHSLPDLIRNLTEDKQRLVVAGTQGKTIITLLLIHVLGYYKRKFDYLSFAQPSGKDSTVSLSNAPLIIIEGQDVRSSPLDDTLCFLRFEQHIGVISDIAWSSQSGVSQDQYTQQFVQFEKSLPKSGVLLYNDKDPVITGILALNCPDVLYVPYAAHPSLRENGQDYLITDKEHFPVKVPGANALLNINAAHETLRKLGITSGMFYQAIRSFQISGR